MMNNEKYEIWRTNKFNDCPTECVGIMYDVGLAEDFISYQASLGESFVVMRDGVRVDTQL